MTMSRSIVPAAEANPQTKSIDAAVSEQRARILRAQSDYDAGYIEAHDLKRNRDAAEVRIQELETERLLHSRTSALVPLLGVENPGAAFRDASLDVRRGIIDTLAAVTLHPQPRGRKGFNPDSVAIEWRR